MPFFVNGEWVADSVVEAEMNAIRQPLFQSMAGQDPAAIEARVRDWARETVIERVLLRQAALREADPIPASVLDQCVHEFLGRNPAPTGCQPSSDDPAVRRAVEARLRIARFLDSLTAKVLPPSEEEIAAHYAEHREDFGGGELLHASHIVKHVHQPADEEPALREICNAEAELHAGGSFAEIADRYSDCPGHGGDIGWFRHGEMVDEFERVVVALSPGEVSGVFRSPFGFHIAKLHERRTAPAPGLDEVRDAVRQMLHARHKERAVERFLDELRDTAEIRPAARHAGADA